MRFDHVGYLVRNTAASMAVLQPFFPRVRMPTCEHPGQGVLVTYLETADGAVTLELVEPTEANPRLRSWLDRENKPCVPYHICVLVDDFDATVADLRRQGWMSLTRPFETLEPGVFASHLYRPEAGIVEIAGRVSEASEATSN